MDVTPLPFLSDQEIAGICEGVTVAGWQCRHLKRMGLFFQRKPNGRPLVARSEFERVLGTATRSEPAAPRPEWKIPPRPAWDETPLGRAQLRERKNRREIAEAEQAVLDALPKPTPAEKKKLEADRVRRVKLEKAAIVRFHASKRRVLKLQRRPAWADMDAIRAIYLEAQRITRDTGIPHHVDHILPLQGRLVSGLHVHNNLQILTGSENSKKRNRFEIEP